MTNQNTKLLCTYLDRLYTVNKRLAVKIESSWGTRRAVDLLLDRIRQIRSNRSQTTYVELRTLIDLYFLHSDTYNFSNTDTIKSVYCDYSA